MMKTFDSIATQSFQSLVDTFKEAATRGGSGSQFLIEALLSYTKGSACNLQNFDRLDQSNRRLLWQLLNSTCSVKWSRLDQLATDLTEAKKKMWSD